MKKQLIPQPKTKIKEVKPKKSIRELELEKDIELLSSQVISAEVEINRKEKVIQQLQSDYEYLKQTSEATRTMHIAIKSEYEGFEKGVRLMYGKEKAGLSSAGSITGTMPTTYRN